MRSKKFLAAVLSLALTMSSISFGTATAAEKTATSGKSDNTPATKLVAGDVDGDDAVSGSDAALVLSEYALIASEKPGNFNAEQKEAADVNIDGSVDGTDASLILMFYAYRSEISDKTITEFLKRNKLLVGNPSGNTGTTTKPDTSVTTTTKSVSTTTVSGGKVTSTTAKSTTSGKGTSTTTKSTVSGKATTTTAKTTVSGKVSSTTAKSTTSGKGTFTTTKSTVSGKATSTTAKTTVSGKASSTTAKSTTSGKASSTTSKSTSTSTKSVLTTSTDTTSAVSTTSKSSSSTSTGSVTTTYADPYTVHEIKLSKTEVKLNVGESDIVIASLLPVSAPNKSVKWTSSDEKTAVVDVDGCITAKSAGFCTITVQSVDNPDVKSEIKVTVTDPNGVTEIRLSKYELYLNVGEKGSSKATILPLTAKNKAQKWISSDETVATVDNEGTITALKSGTCTITVLSIADPSVKADIKLTVTEKDKVSDIRLSKVELDLRVGEGDMVMMIMLPSTAANKSAVWSSSDESIAVVDNEGWITGLKEGSCVVTVKSVSDPDVKAEVKVNVKTNSNSSSSGDKTPSSITYPSNHVVRVIDGVTFIDGILVVNKTYGLPEDYAPGALNPTAKEQFAKLAGDAAVEGMSIFVSSGYRSYAEQEKIYNNYVSTFGKTKTDFVAARPGHSENQTGLAIDVNYMSDTFASSPEAKWLADNAYKYGFIIRYPKGKESITGYQYEPWHIRYVGADTAKVLHDNNWTLEEYLGIDSYYQD